MSSKSKNVKNKEVQDLSLKCSAWKGFIPFTDEICVMVYISPGKQSIPSRIKEIKFYYMLLHYGQYLGL